MPRGGRAVLRSRDCSCGTGRARTEPAPLYFPMIQTVQSEVWSKPAKLVPDAAAPPFAASFSFPAGHAMHTVGLFPPTGGVVVEYVPEAHTAQSVRLSWCVASPVPTLDVPPLTVPAGQFAQEPCPDCLLYLPTPQTLQSATAS